MDHSIVSVIIPCRNEEKFIYNALKCVEEQSVDNDRLQIIIGDGESSDKTVDEIKRFKADFPNLSVEIVNNASRVVPHALNTCIKIAKGDVVVRLDAHSEYPTNYIEVLLRTLNEFPDAWNVGGVWDTQAGADTNVAQAIVIATSHRIGIGNAEYRLKNSTIKKVDTVPFGCFRKEVFSKIGFFDEELIRNQDDEFNGRIIKNGGSIYLIPDLKVKYFARATFSKLGTMFYQYGLFKPLVSKKLGSPATIRQFAPLILVFVMLFGWIPSLVWSSWIIFYLSGLVFYFILIFAASILISKKGKLIIPLTVSFFIIHFSYGWGYLSGIVKFILFNQKVEVESYKPSR